MAAAAYKVSLIVALGSPNGPRKIFPVTASDVAAAYWLFPSGSADQIFHGMADAYIVDAIYSAAGTDTTNVSFFVQGTNTGTIIYNATSLATTITRPLNIAPFRVPAGQAFKAQQNA